VKWLEFIFSWDVISKVTGSVITAAIIGACKYVPSWIIKHRLTKRLEEDHYTPAEIKKRAVSNRATYVRPDCQNNNPASPSPDVNRRPIFQEVDRLLGADQPARFTLILADTGMGKSTFLERYYAYRWRSARRCKHFKPVVIPLNGLDANELIDKGNSQARGETVLLLDALDEDNGAIEDFAHRFDDLVRLAGKFRAVVVTCRTQFLTDVSCIPKEIDLPAPSGPMPLSTSPDRMVRPLYLSPFSDAQVKKYLAARFPYWCQPVLRARANRMANRFKDLMSRPLLLTFIHDLASCSQEPKYSFQAYRIIVESWVEREKYKHKLMISSVNLLRFCEEFAVSLFATGRDRVPSAELYSMAERFGVGPIFRQVCERSLLHNDAEGNWKFVHRSIMEYFLVSLIERYLLVAEASNTMDRPDWSGRAWTDQMRRFTSEMLRSCEYKHLSGADLHGLDLKGADLSGVDLHGANLSGANLCDAHMSAANLSGANLTEVRLENASIDFANLQGACLDRTVLCGVDLGKVHGLTLQQATTAIVDQLTIWPVHTLVGHSDSVLSVAVTPNGRRAVSASWDYTLKLWDMESRRELHTFTGHSKFVSGVMVTPDGRYAVSASWDKTLKLWDLETGDELCTFTGHSNRVNGVAVTLDGRRVVSASSDTTLKIWDLETGCEQRTLVGHTGSVNGVAVTPDGRRAVSASADSTLKVWDLETSAELCTLEGHTGPVNGVAVTQDGKCVVSASSDETLKVWNLETGAEMRTLAGHSYQINSVTVTPNGLAVSASFDGTLMVWDVESGRELLTLRGHTAPVSYVAISADGRLVVSASWDRTLRVWFPTEETESSLK
jgi:WD40 repeat protein